MAMENTQGEVIIYQTDDGDTKIDVRFVDETVWLTQQQMAELFQSSRTNIVEHIKHIYEEAFSIGMLLIPFWCYFRILNCLVSNLIFNVSSFLYHHCYVALFVSSLVLKLTFFAAVTWVLGFNNSIFLGGWQCKYIIFAIPKSCWKLKWYVIRLSYRRYKIWQFK